MNFFYIASNNMQMYIVIQNGITMENKTHEKTDYLHLLFPELAC